MHKNFVRKIFSFLTFCSLRKKCSLYNICFLCLASFVELLPKKMKLQKDAENAETLLCHFVAAVQVITVHAELTALLLVRLVTAVIHFIADLV